MDYTVVEVVRGDLATMEIAERELTTGQLEREGKKASMGTSAKMEPLERLSLKSDL